MLGATSDIARAVALRYAAAGWRLQLAARDDAALARECRDLTLRHGRPVESYLLDVVDPASVSALLARLTRLPDVVVCAIGRLGDQRQSETDGAELALTVAANYVGPAQVLGALAEQFVARGSGTLVAISSVAGERGRAANYSYGSAKAGLTAWLSGLRNRLALAGSPVRVVTVILGYAQTPMTEGMDLPGWLVSSPEAVAGRVVRAVERGQDVIYVSRKWRLIMAIIRLIPERVFKRLRL